MHLAVPAPAAECLAFVVEEEAKKTPQQDETRVCHDGRNESTLNSPRGDELAESITPHVLVDSDADN